MIISNKGLSVIAARHLIDQVCGGNDLPLFVLHDFDFDGFKIFGTLQRDTRRYQFSSAIEVIDLGLRLGDIEGLEREPAAATKVNEQSLRSQLAQNGATAEETEFLLNDRVELNALTSEALLEMIERKLNAYGLKKVVPGDDLLGKTYLVFHRSNELEAEFEKIEEKFKESTIEVPKDLRIKIGAILKKYPALRWDDAIKVVLDETRLSDVMAEKQKAKRDSGDFTGDDDTEDDGDDD
jgi:hypothetical protein